MVGNLEDMGMWDPKSALRMAYHDSELWSATLEVTSRVRVCVCVCVCV